MAESPRHEAFTSPVLWENSTQVFRAHVLPTFHPKVVARSSPLCLHFQLLGWSGGGQSQSEPHLLKGWSSTEEVWLGGRIAAFL